MKYNPDLSRSLPWAHLLPVQQATVHPPKDRRWFDKVLLTGEYGWGKTFSAVWQILRQATGENGFKAMVVVPDTLFFLDAAQPAFQQQLDSLALTAETDYEWTRKGNQLVFSNGSRIAFRTHRQLKHAHYANWVYVMDLNALKQKYYPVLHRSLKAYGCTQYKLILETSGPFKDTDWQAQMFCNRPDVRTFTGTRADNPVIPDWATADPLKPCPFGPKRRVWVKPPAKKLFVTGGLPTRQPKPEAKASYQLPAEVLENLQAFKHQAQSKPVPHWKDFINQKDEPVLDLPPKLASMVPIFQELSEQQLRDLFKPWETDEPKTGT
jgi:hypothetical protein